MFTFGQPLGSISFGPQAQATPMNPTIMALIENYMAMGMSRMEAEVKARQQIAQMAAVNNPVAPVAAPLPIEPAPQARAEPVPNSEPKDTALSSTEEAKLYQQAASMFFAQADKEEQERARQEAELEALHPGILQGRYQPRGQQSGLLNYTPARPIGLFG